jgi:type III pantothenate kinase
MLVADIGNTRMKWGQCGPAGILQSASVAPEQPDEWRAQLGAWRLNEPQAWTVAGVHPARRDRFVDWLRQQGQLVRVLTRHTELPLEVLVEAPEQVGIDRLLNVLAAKALVPRGVPALVVDAGSAITVNVLSEEGAFAGGAIFPGLRLMAQALHDHTAQLPLVNVTEHSSAVPAGTTVTAIAAGIHWAAAGGLHALLKAMSLVTPTADPLHVFLTGGDAARLRPDLPDRDLFRYELRPVLTLEGLRLAAEKKGTSP